MTVCGEFHRMSEQVEPTSSARLARQIRAAYVVGLALVAAMATISFWSMSIHLNEQKRNTDVLSLLNDQAAAMQEMTALARTVDGTNPAIAAILIDHLEATYRKFSDRHKALVDTAGGSAAAIFFARPYNLDHFSTTLAARVKRLVAQARTDLARTRGENFRLSEPFGQAEEALTHSIERAFAAVNQEFAEHADRSLADTLAAHRTIYVSTLALLGLVGLVIFRPMAQAIVRRTNDLIEARNTMEFLATHDRLTGLHNRAFLIEHFGKQLSSAKRRGEQLAVLQIDLDGFKQINDTLGHAAGDFVLVTTAQRISETARHADVAVRLGGDEFVVVLSAPGEIDDIGGIARRILGKINQPIIYEGVTIDCGASAGIAVYPIDASTVDDLLIHADLALYSAKKAGRGTYSFFSEELRRELDYRKMLEQDLKVAIAEQAFSVYFQPQITLMNGQVAGVEALVRWSHPQRGMIAPGEFIPIAEKTGLMAQIGKIVISKAIFAAAEWHRSGIQFGRLAVNVSGAELRETDFTKFLFDTLEEAGLPAQKLSLEIVESVILDDEKTGVAGRLRQIRAAGVHLELDDFGTGYASLSHVNPKEIDRLKIDRRFVQKINTNDDNSAIVRAITELARSLGIAIIAEGAETEEELSSLLSIGCEQVQGYSIAFPMPVDQARDWLAQRSPRKSVLRLAASSA